MNYKDIFDERGAAYHRAMQQWPTARSNDFLQPLAWLTPAPGATVLDAPAGGGYLQRYLPPTCRYIGHEPSTGFTDHAGVTAAELLPLPVADSSVDCAYSIAGLHHVENKSGFYTELERVLRPGGQALVADVHRDSAVAVFLDDFVGRYNSTGHQGYFLDNNTTREISAAGLTIERAERNSYCWWFDDRTEMADFCTLLFDIRSADTSTVTAALASGPGIRESNNRIGLNWELYFVLVTKT